MFIDLHTDYSLLESLIKIDTDDRKSPPIKDDNLIAHAILNKWEYMGIADNTAGGLLDFYLACKEAKIKPLLGLRFFITNNLESITDSQIILYAQNNNGYHNLLKLFSKAATDGFKNDNVNLLIEWMEGDLGKDLVCILPIGESPNESKSDVGDKVAQDLRRLFKGKLFFGLYNRNCAIDDIWLEKAKANNVPYLFLSNAKYLKTNDIKAYRVLRSISEKTTLDRLFESVWLDESIEAAEKTFAMCTHKDYLKKFLDLINLDIPTPGLKVPQFPVPAPHKDSYDYLVALCRKGYKEKLEEFDTPEKKKACVDRLKIELDVMKRCNLSDYFLLVYDICNYCDENGVPRGLARGSCAGALTAFLLDISRVNPLTYDLLFERFLNEDRTRPVEFNGEIYLTDAPDIDLDVGQIQRQQVIEFLRERYGHVAKIATYTTLSAKACVKDVIRVFGRSEKEAMYVASSIEIRFGKSDSLEDTYKKSDKFREWADRNKEIYETALKLENIRKNASQHAAGLIISSEPVENRAPLFLANSTGDEFKRDTCVAYSLDFAAKAGLLKVDILGIRGLNVLQDTTELIK